MHIAILLTFLPLALAAPSPPDGKDSHIFITMQTYKDASCSAKATVGEETEIYDSTCTAGPGPFSFFYLHEYPLSDVEFKGAKKIGGGPCSWKFWTDDKCTGDPIMSTIADKVARSKCNGVPKEAKSWKFDCPGDPGHTGLFVM